jgi:hypothetical protein
MVDGDTSEASTVDSSQPTRIDATLLELPVSRLHLVLSAAREYRSAAAAVTLVLLLGINLLLLERLIPPETGGSIQSEGVQIPAAILEASTHTTADTEPDARVAPESVETAATESQNPEPSAAPAGWEYQSRVFSGERLRVEAAIDSEGESILPATRSTEPPATLAESAKSREPSPPPAAATPDAGEETLPQQPSGSTGGQGWIIERN